MTAPFSFDGENKLVTLDQGVTEFTVVQLWSRWVEWVTIGDNSKFLPALRSVGGDEISTTQSLGATFFMTNGWKIRPHEASHTLVVNGNLYTDPAGFSPFVSTVGAFNVNIESRVSNLTDSSVSQLEELEQLSFEGVVQVDQVSGESGTTYPVGSRSTWSNNYTDAATICDSRKIRKILTHGIYNTEIGEAISGKSFLGLNLNVDRIVTQAGTALVGCNYEKLWLSGQGIVAGTFVECFVENIPTLLGGAKDTGFLGEFSFINAPPFAFQAFDCHTTKSTDSFAILNMVAGVNVLLHRCSGHWKLRGMTAGNHVFNMAAGHVELEPTCTGGTVIIRGDAKVTDNSNGTTVVYEGLSLNGLSPQQTANLQTAATESVKARKLIQNKAVISGDTVTIYEDDGVTILQQWSISPDKSERVPL